MEKKWIGRLIIASVISAGLIFGGCGNPDKKSFNTQQIQASDKTSDSSNFKLLSEEEDRSLANLKDMRNTSTKVYIYTDPDTKVQYLIISDTIKNKLGDYIDHKIAITPRYIVNRDGAYSIMREDD